MCSAILNHLRGNVYPWKCHICVRFDVQDEMSYQKFVIDTKGIKDFYEDKRVILPFN